jgi:hypothetical protein
MEAGDVTGNELIEDGERIYCKGIQMAQRIEPLNGLKQPLGITGG